MPSSSSTGQALATAPTSPSVGDKGGVSSGIASRVGGGGGALGGRQAPAFDSHSSPTFGTPLHDRSSSPSPFDSSAAGRKRKKVYYGKKEESDLSELYQEGEEEESSEEESEGYAESEEGESASDAEHQVAASDGRTTGLRPPATPLWPAEGVDALERGLALVPSLGKRSVPLAGKGAGRNGLLAEYVRRQTGRVYSRIQVGAMLKTLKRRAKGNKQRLQLVQGVEPDEEALTRRDWSSHLGPDLHPPSKKRFKQASARQRKKSKRIKQEPKTPSSSAFPTLTTPALPSSSAYPPPPSTYYQSYSNPPYHPQLTPTYSAPQSPPLPPQLAQSSSSSSSPVLAAPPRHPPPQGPPPTPLSSLDLSAFLSSSSPSYDLSRVSSAFLSAGLTSLEDLASLLVFEDWSFEAFLQQALGGVDEAERATVKAVLERARREFARGDSTEQ